MDQALEGLEGYGDEKATSSASGIEMLSRGHAPRRFRTSDAKTKTRPEARMAET